MASDLKNQAPQPEAPAEPSVGSVEWWLQAALHCPEFHWDPDQRECAEGALAERLDTPPTPAASSREAVELSDAEIDALHGLDTAERVRFYEHDFYPLSNFSAFNLQWAGMKFQTSEHAYHYMKFAKPWGDEDRDEPIDFEGPEVLITQAIYGAPSAHEAFKIAEQNKSQRRPDWNAIKVSVMRDILRAKAMQHSYVLRKLLATGDRELVEDSWRDDFWGWGPERNGTNMLGKLWMEIRAELRAASKEKAS